MKYATSKWLPLCTPCPAGRKSTAITCAKRMAQFLGDERIRDKGLVCNYVIARRPESQPTAARAIPVAIFSTEPSVARSYLRQWCGGDIGSSEWLWGSGDGSPECMCAVGSRRCWELGFLPLSFQVVHMIHWEVSHMFTDGQYQCIRYLSQASGFLV